MLEVKKMFDFNNRAAICLKYHLANFLGDPQQFTTLNSLLNAADVLVYSWNDNFYGHPCISTKL